MSTRDHNDGKDGIVCTFYSYKGGVGRSMALANVAALLAGDGYKVLIVDWDLEAPGLHKYFTTYLDEEADEYRSLVDAQGVVDWIHAFKHGKDVDWRSYTTPIGFPGLLGSLDIIKAGASGAQYALKLGEINWIDLFVREKGGLGPYFEKVRSEWMESYDFVLIDSRTGVSDAGGICTVVFPDLLLVFFTSNEQSIQGCVSVVEMARDRRQEWPAERGQLIALPVLTRDEVNAEYLQSSQWRDYVARVMKRFYDDWLPRAVDASEALRRLYVPYQAYWAFGERMPVVERPEDMRDPASLSAAYRRLATLIGSRLDWESLEVAVDASEMQRLRGHLDLLETTVRERDEKISQEEQQITDLTGKTSRQKKKTRKLKRRTVLLGMGGSAGAMAFGAIGYYLGLAARDREIDRSGEYAKSAKLLAYRTDAPPTERIKAIKQVIAAGDRVFEKIDISRLRFERMDFSGCDFRNSFLRYSSFPDCSFENAILQFSDMDQADMDRANLDGANCRECGMAKLAFRAGRAKRAKFNLCIMEEAQLDGTDFESANLASSRLQGASLVKTKLRQATLTGTKLMGADLTEAQLVEANLTGADLSRAMLRSANLTDANLEGAVLDEAKLAGANLTNAKLARAKVIRADLTGADLSGIMFEGADFTGTDLSVAKNVPAALLSTQTAN